MTIRLRKPDKRIAKVAAKDLSKTGLLQRLKGYEIPFFIIASSLVQTGYFFIHCWRLGKDRSHLWFSYTMVTHQDPMNPCIWLGSYFDFVPFLRHEFYRLVTYQLSHVGLFHLGGNVLIQAVMGSYLELEYGTLNIGLLYTMGVVFAPLLSYCTRPDKILNGASEGVSALVVAHFCILFCDLLQRRKIKSPKTVAAVSAFYVFLVVFCDAHPHLAGAITGLAFSAYIKAPSINNKWAKEACKFVVKFYIFAVAVLALNMIVKTPTTKYDQQCAAWTRAQGQ